MKSSTANVVILIPPAVPAGPPPINMSTSIPTRLARICPMSIQLKPAVLVWTEWKKPSEERAAGPAPELPGFDHSTTVM